MKWAYLVDSPWQRVSSPVAVEAHQRLHVVVAQLVVERLTEQRPMGKTHMYTHVNAVMETGVYNSEMSRDHLDIFLDPTGRH